MRSTIQSASNDRIDDGGTCNCHVSRRTFMLGIGGAAIGSALRAEAATTLSAQPGPALDENLLDDIVLANRILFQKGVLDTYGHVSVRDPRRPDRFWMSRALAPAKVARDDIMEYDLDCNALNARGRASYYEKWIHGEIYKARPDVHSIVHSHSPTVIPFSVAKDVPMRPLLQMAGFLSPGVPVFDNRSLVPDTDLMIGRQLLGREMARKLGPSSSVVLLRGHGNVVVGPSIEVAVFRAYYTEVNARAEEQAIALAGEKVIYMTPEESAAAEKVVGSPASVSRAWQQWKEEARKN